MVISIYISRIQRNGAIGIINGLVRFLEILRIDERQLPIRLGVVRVRLDGVLQNINRLRKILLPYEQSRHARGELRLARIHIEHLAIRLQRSIHLAVPLKRHAFHKMRQCAGSALAFWTQSEIRRWLEIEEVILSIDFDWGR